MDKEDDNLKSEYPNKHDVRDVQNSEKHVRVAESRDKLKKVQKTLGKSSAGEKSGFPEGKAGAGSFGQRSSVEGKSESAAAAAVATVEDSEGERLTRDSDHGPELDCCRKKKRKTEQEKLIASLNETELTHVDGAFKRSTTIRYNNLNEDRLFEKMFDNRMGKPKRSSGKKLLCLEEVAGLEGASEPGKEDMPEEEKPVEAEAVQVAPQPIQAEVKKKRKTEKEKLIESLSAIERIHVDGAFKRNVFNHVSLSAVTGSSQATGVANNNNNVPEAAAGGSGKKTGSVFSPVKFVGLTDDIESLIKEKVTGKTT